MLTPTIMTLILDALTNTNFVPPPPEIPPSKDLTYIRTTNTLETLNPIGTFSDFKKKFQKKYATQEEEDFRQARFTVYQKLSIGGQVTQYNTG